MLPRPVNKSQQCRRAMPCAAASCESAARLKGGREEGGDGLPLPHPLLQRHHPDVVQAVVPRADRVEVRVGILPIAR